MCVLCIDKASTYRRFDIVILQGLRTLIVSEGAEVATWNGFSSRVVKAILHKTCTMGKVQKRVLTGSLLLKRAMMHKKLLNFTVIDLSKWKL